MSEAQEARGAARLLHRKRPLKFSLFYFADTGAGSGRAQYDFLLETARFGDRHGFHAIWTPERHFHSFGGLYPNPAVLSAALAMTTERIQIRAGSVVLPLHHPVRVCEDWALVDNLSGGRVGVSFASGWHRNDFVLSQEPFESRKEVTFDRLGIVQRLWRGERVQMSGGMGGTFEPRLFPRPIQPDLPIWITSSGNPDTFVRAGAAGVNILAGIGQSVEQLAETVRLYRQARRDRGVDPSDGRVTVMVHTFVDQDPIRVRQVSREPLRSYLGSYLRQQEDAGPAYEGRGDLDLETRLDFAVERYLKGASLIGTPASCIRLLDDLVEADIDEVACLIDFGIDLDTVLPSLENLCSIRDRYS
jgi:natural product biosynthesis luciferase-like monooxygenase protein